MLVFGTGQSTAHSQKLPFAVCQSCQKAELKKFIQYSYFHIFWLPLFPYRREVATECSHCKEYLLGNEVEEDLRSSLNSAAAPPPLRLFSGIAALFLLFFVLEHFSAESKRNMAEYVANPIINDSYVFELAENDAARKQGQRYGVFRIAAIDGDQLSVNNSNYVYEYFSDASKALRKGVAHIKDYYSLSEDNLSLKYVQEMHSRGLIKAVIRTSRGGVLSSKRGEEK